MNCILLSVYLLDVHINVQFLGCGQNWFMHTCYGRVEGIIITLPPWAYINRHIPASTHIVKPKIELVIIVFNNRE